MIKIHHQDIENLPAYAIAGEVNRILSGSPRLIITAPPGAGKSTVLPLTILEAFPKGKILMLEPRRVAARQIAERMAWLLGEPVGKTVGYRVRFESKISRETRIEVLTEGILGRRLIEDPGLEGVSVVIFDEFHERSLQCDEALALTRQAQLLLREDLRMVLMSATIDTKALSAAIDAPVLESEGKMYPVEIRRAKEASPETIAEEVAHTIREAHKTEAGDILAFLPGEAEIRRCEELLGMSLGTTHICPLYGMLSNAEQKAAIGPSAAGERKVVLATPIAETSLTIEGVRVVVDGGFYKTLVVDPRSGLSHLETVRVSMDMATQRSGRAGRVAPGVCYRLWGTGTEARMAPVRTPEILSADLTSLVLDAAAWGEADITSLPWVTSPPKARVLAARGLLQSLTAIDADGRITPHGKALAALPCHPRVAQMLLTEDKPGSKALASDIAAILEEKDPLADVQDVGLDLRLRALRDARHGGRYGRWARVVRIAEQYARMASSGTDDSRPDPYEVGLLVASAYPERIGRAWKEGGPGRFLLSGGEQVEMDPADPLAASEWIAVASMTSRPGRAGRVFLAAPVSAEDIRRLATERDAVLWDRNAGCVVARRERRIGNLLVDSSPLSEGVREQQVMIIAEAARKDGTSMFDFSEEVQNLQRRVAAVSLWHPELGLPDLSTEAVLDRAGEWVPLFVGKATSIPQLKKIDLLAVLWSLLSYEQQQAVERLAPTHMAVPTGSHIRLEYRQGAEAPVLRVRLQECFGLVDTPRVDGGNRPVLMELLSPGYKPVQLTTDLASFWNGTYFEVRKELRRRYPKHYWPDNPLEAEPARGIKKNK